MGGGGWGDGGGRRRRGDKECYGGGGPPSTSQAFLGDERAHHHPGHQRHPRQQPLLEALLRPPALRRRVFPKDFRKTFLEKHKDKTGGVGDSGGYVSMVSFLKCLEIKKTCRCFHSKAREVRWIPSRKRSHPHTTGGAPVTNSTTYGNFSSVTTRDSPGIGQLYR